MKGALPSASCHLWGIDQVQLQTHVRSFPGPEVRSRRSRSRNCPQVLSSGGRANTDTVWTGSINRLGCEKQDLTPSGFSTNKNELCQEPKDPCSKTPGPDPVTHPSSLPAGSQDVLSTPWSFMRSQSILKLRGHQGPVCTPSRPLMQSLDLCPCDLHPGGDLRGRVSLFCLSNNKQRKAEPRPLLTCSGVSLNRITAARQVRSDLIQI